MDYETKILLGNLIDAVNSTNWWMFGVSAISAVASLVISFMLWRTTKRIGERQNELQRNNIKLMLFDKRYEVYKAIVEAKAFLNRGDHFLNGIYDPNYFGNMGRMFTDKLEKLNDAYLESEALFNRDIYEKVEEILIRFVKTRTMFFELNKVGYSYINELKEDQLNHIREIIFINTLDLETIREEIEKIIPHLFDKLSDWQNLVYDFNNYISKCQIMTDFDSYLKINNIDK